MAHGEGEVVPSRGMKEGAELYVERDTMTSEEQEDLRNGAIPVSALASAGGEDAVPFPWVEQQQSSSCPPGHTVLALAQLPVELQPGYTPLCCPQQAAAPRCLCQALNGLFITCYKFGDRPQVSSPCAIGTKASFLSSSA